VNILFYRPVVFKLGYAYTRGYTKTFYGVCNIEEKNRDRHKIIRARFRDSHRRPYIKTFGLGEHFSLSVSDNAALLNAFVPLLIL
jgi:hypothetical protein